MKIEKYYTSDSIQKPSIEDCDKELLEYLIDQYGAESLFNTMNEATYYGTGGRFDYTGGSRVRGLSGAIQSIPSLAMTTAVFWPLALFLGVSALVYRFQKNFEDRNSWLNRLDPRFWVEYLATPKDGKSSSPGKESWMSRAKSALGKGLGTAASAAGGAVAGVVAGKELTDDKEEKKEVVMNAAFVPYWVTLSNGEILRVRADSEEHAKATANLILGYTKPVYEQLNQKIEQGNPRYTFYFDDGEMCYWSAPSQAQAYKEALQTRTDLCKAMNNLSPKVTQLEDLSKPKVDGKVIVSRTEKIEIPQQGNFRNVTTNQPHREKEIVKELPKPVYKYGTLSNFRSTYANFLFNVPAYNEGEAKEIIRYINSKNRSIDRIYDRMNRKLDLYSVHMKDGDIYVIPGESINDVGNIALSLYDTKNEAIQKVLQDASLEEYEDFITDYGDRVRGVKNVKAIDPEKNYTFKKGDVATLIKIIDKDEKEKYDNFKL